MTCHTTRHDWGCRLHLTYLCAKYLDICQFYKNERKNGARDRSSSLNRPADLFKYIVANYFITISFHQIWSTLTFSFEKVISNLSFFHDMHFSCAVLTINRDWPLPASHMHYGNMSTSQMLYGNMPTSQMCHGDMPTSQMHHGNMSNKSNAPWEFVQKELFNHFESGVH